MSEKWRKPGQISLSLMGVGSMLSKVEDSRSVLDFSFANDTFVPLRIKATDVAIRNRVIAVGGRWNPGKKLWFVIYGNTDWHSAGNAYRCRWIKISGEPRLPYKSI